MHSLGHVCGAASLHWGVALVQSQSNDDKIIIKITASIPQQTNATAACRSFTRAPALTDLFSSRGFDNQRVLLVSAFAPQNPK